MTLEQKLIYIQETFGDDEEIAMQLMMLALESSSVEEEQAEIAESRKGN